MPRKPKPAQPAEQTQPVLFKTEELVQQLGTAAKRYVHTGKTTCRNEQLVADILEHYLQCNSLLAVARRFHVSPNTVKAVLGVFEAEGKLDGVKERLSGKLDTIAELAADTQIEMLNAGTVPAQVVGIMGAVAIDKRVMLETGGVIRHQVVAATDVEVDQVRAFLAGKGIAAPALDVQSTVEPQKPQESEGKP